MDEHPGRLVHFPHLGPVRPGDEHVTARHAVEPAEHRRVRAVTSRLPLHRRGVHHGALLEVTRGDVPGDDVAVGARGEERLVVRAEPEAAHAVVRGRAVLASHRRASRVSPDHSNALPFRRVPNRDCAVGGTREAPAGRQPHRRHHRVLLRGWRELTGLLAVRLGTRRFAPPLDVVNSVGHKRGWIGAEWVKRDSVHFGGNVGVPLDLVHALTRAGLPGEQPFLRRRRDDCLLHRGAGRRVR